MLSVVALAGGAVAVRRSPTRRSGAAPIAADAGLVERRPTASTLRGLNALADRVAGVVQSGSLPVYLGVILLTAAVIPGALLVTGDVVAGLARPGRVTGSTSRSRP